MDSKTSTQVATVTGKAKPHSRVFAYYFDFRKDNIFSEKVL